MSVDTLQRAIKKLGAKPVSGNEPELQKQLIELKSPKRVYGKPAVKFLAANLQPIALSIDLFSPMEENRENEDG